MTLWQTTPRGRNPPHELYVIIETPRGQRNKYEVAKHFPGVLLDRILHASLAYPADYGLVPQSWGEDGDPLDALVIGSHPVHPGAIVRARPIGVLHMVDGGDPDEKIVCALIGDPRTAHLQKLEDAGQAFLDEVEEFFRTYKRLESGKEAIEIKGWGDVDEAHRLLEEAFQRYHKKFETQ